MTELEIMKNAEACLRFLANGTDPFTKESVPEDDVVKKKEISKYLNFTADFLHRKISDMQEVQMDSVVPETPEFEIMDEGILISQIAKYLNYVLHRPESSQFTAKSLIFWLIEQGIISGEDSSHKTVTQTGADIGISQAISEKGSKVLLYGSDAQQYIYQHIDQFITYFEQHEEEFVDRRELFCLTPEQKAYLSPFAEEATISDMTKYLNSLIDTSQVKPLKNGILSGWLFSNRILEKKGNQKQYTPTSEGENIGILCRSYTRNGYEFYTSIFTAQAQQYIFDHIDDLTEFNQLEN